MLLNCGVGEDSWESLGLQGDPTSPSWRRSVLGVHWKDWCWSWNSNTLATWCGELTHLKRPWCWERLRAGGKGDDRGLYGWMASPTQWAWVWIDSGSLWWTGRPGMLQFMGSQRVRQDWTTKLKNTGVGSLSLLQGIFLNQGSNPGLPHCWQILYQLSHSGSPRILEWVAYPFSSRSSWPSDQTGVY